MDKATNRQLVLGNPIITLGSQPQLEDGALIVEGNTIVAAGSRAELEKQGPFDRTIGSADHIILPGFPNSHFHCAIFNEDRWLQYPVERGMPYYLPHSLTEEEHYHRTLLRLAACIRGGQTMLSDFGYGNPALDRYGFPATLQAFRDIGMRGSLAIATRDRNLIVHCSDEEFLASLPADVRKQTLAQGIGNLGPAEELLELFKSLYKEWHDPEKGTVLELGPDWTPCTSDDLYLKNRGLAEEYGVRLATHACESRHEMTYHFKSYGKTPMQRLNDLGVLGPDFSIAHFVWATDEDIQILADSGAIAIQNPGTNLKIGNGITRVRDIMQAGGRVAFGTDASSFSNTEDFFQELHLADILQRIAGNLETGRIDSLELLKSAVCHGSEACGYGDSVGSLVPGHAADFLVLKTDRLSRVIREYPTRPPYASGFSASTILDYAQSCDIETVIIGGNVVLEHGKLTLIDEEKSRDFLENIARTREELGAGIADQLDPFIMDFYRKFPKLELTPASFYNSKACRLNEP